MTDRRLLELDGVGNVLLGLPLLLFPGLVSEFLGLPATAPTLYPVVLGAVFIGIGVALLLQRFRPSFGGLGLGGALSINLIFAVALAGWLLRSGTALLPRGLLVLWILALILLGISLAEALSVARRKSP